MAKPQTEEGYTRIANELLDALISCPMTSTQWPIVMVVIRNTYGWNRKAAPFTWSGIARSIRSDRTNTRRAGKELIRVGVLFLDSDGQIGVNKDYEGWGELAPKEATAPGRVRPRGGARSPQGVGAVYPRPTVELKTVKTERQEGPISFEEQERRAHWARCLAEDQRLQERTRRVMEGYKPPPQARPQ